MNTSSWILETDFGLNVTQSFFHTGIQSEFFQLAMNIINILLSFPINSYVIWLILSGTGNGLALEIFMLNLSIAEIFMCFTICLYIIGKVCRIPVELMIILNNLTMTSRPLFQTLMCVERYLAVVHPVTFLKYKPLRYRLVCSAVSWLLIFASNGISLVINLSFLQFQFYSYYLAQILLFFLIQSFCLVAVLRALKQSGPGDKKKEEKSNMKRRAFMIILITTVSMIIVYAPYLASYVLAHLGEVVESLTYILVVCFLLGTWVQPLLFLHRVGKLPSFCE